MVISAGILKMLVKIANRETLTRLLLQEQFDSGLPCLSRLRHFNRAANVRNLRTLLSFTILTSVLKKCHIGPMLLGVKH